MSSDFVENLDGIEGGLTVSIHMDSDTSMPYEEDEGVHIVILHNRYSDPAKGKLGRSPVEVREWCQANPDWYTVPLWVYDHSGTVYQVAADNPFHCRWDSGRAGLIALKRSEWGNGEESDEVLFEYAQNIASSYTSWTNGDCYGYIVKDTDGEELDSCWGFVGRNTVEEEARSSAKSIAARLETAAPAL